MPELVILISSYSPLALGRPPLRLPMGCSLRDPVPASLAARAPLCGENGNRLIEEKQPEKGEQQLAEAVKVCPTDCDARRYYAEALWMRNARQDAIAQLEEACRLSPECELRVRLAEMYLEMGRLDDAARNVDQVLVRQNSSRPRSASAPSAAGCSAAGAISYWPPATPIRLATAARPCPRMICIAPPVTIRPIGRRSARRPPSIAASASRNARWKACSR